MDLAEKIKDAIGAALGDRDGFVPLHEPLFNGNEKKYLGNCIDSTFVSSVGKYVDEFEMELAAFTGARRAVALVSGTSALQVALRVAGVGAGDEVVIPALSFVATANAVHYLGAHPHFADSVEDTLGLDPVALRDWLAHIGERTSEGTRNRYTGRIIRAVVPMHIFGHPCDMDALLRLAQEYQLILVEDAAESLGSYYKGRHTGSFGLCGAISFNGNKTITTGGGGAIVTNNDRLADQAKYLTTTAKQAHRWEYVHDEIGYNFRMPNLNAALGCAQLEQLSGFLASKRRLTDQYQRAFSDIPQVRLLLESADCKSNYWLQALILEEDAVHHLDVILEITNESGFMTRPIWRPVHQLKPYRQCQRSPLPVAERLARRIINLPSGAGWA